jgi:S-adenosylmethionine hydrolase
VRAKKSAALTGRTAEKKPGLPVITLLTDFGTSDYFVGAMKGAILSRNPNVLLVDITHDIPPQNIESGAFTLLAAYKSLPLGTIHLVVVDPGVGSARRPIVVEAGGHFFVGPDNGLFSYVYERESKWRVFQLTNNEYFAESPCPTFHGRDLFGPVAAALAAGVKPDSLGPLVEDPVRLKPLKPELNHKGKLRARVIHIDRFGNCITNITRDDLPTGANTKLIVRKKTIKEIREYFAEGKSGPFAIWGSAGFLEIAVKNGSAAEVLHATIGDTVHVLQK